jgi:hypothetical protein
MEATQIITVEPTGAIKRLRDRQRRVERITIAILALIVSVMVGVILFLPVIGGGLEWGAEKVRNPAEACKNPKNKNMPYCQDRIGRAEADWREMSRFQGGKVNKFTLHGKE